MTDSGWQDVPHNLILRGPTSESQDDYIIFEIGSELQKASQLDISEASNFFIGQDVFVLGYPALWPSPGSKANGGFLPGFVKRGIFSGVISIGGFENLFLLDLMLNKGMSGGPVFARNHRNNTQITLAGIAISYFGPAEKISGDQSDSLAFNANTGLAFCIPVGDILKRI